MKKLLLLFAAISLTACSKDDDCSGEADKINAHYDILIAQVVDNPGPNGIDDRQISYLEAERELKLDQACD